MEKGAGEAPIKRPASREKDFLSASFWIFFLGGEIAFPKQFGGMHEDNWAEGFQEGLDRFARG